MAQHSAQQTGYICGKDEAELRSSTALMSIH